MVYIPPWFGARVCGFVLTIWFFAAVTGCGITVVPLLAGRLMLKLIFGPDSDDQRINDIYAFSLGAYTLGALLYLAVHIREVRKWVRRKVRTRISQRTYNSLRLGFDALKNFALCAMRVVYVYGYLGVFLPLFFSAILELYLIIPLHSLSSALQAEPENATSAAQESMPLASHVAANTSLSLHTVYLIQDWTLGILFTRIAFRFVTWNGETILSRAFQAIIANGGYFNPAANLATKYFIVPSILISIPVLIAPSAFAALIRVTLLKDTPEEGQILFMRFIYPMAALTAIFCLATMQVRQEMDRWRARIRDEVYLIGERLHNLGEKKLASKGKGKARARA
jgi:E3 ubiquitin-protein ligase MARCH6